MQNYRAVIVAVILVFATMLGVYYLFVYERERQLAIQEDVPAPIDVESSAIETQSTGETEVTLYFYASGTDPSRSGFLSSQTRSVFQVEDSKLMARQLLRELLRGSGSGSQTITSRDESGEIVEGSRRSPLSDAIRLREVYLLDDGTAIVDLSVERFRRTIGGITSELAVIESITRTLRENIKQVERVQFLVDGQQRPTLAGHVSIIQPFM